MRVEPIVSLAFFLLVASASVRIKLKINRQRSREAKRFGGVLCRKLSEERNNWSLCSHSREGQRTVDREENDEAHAGCTCRTPLGIVRRELRERVPTIEALLRVFRTRFGNAPGERRPLVRVVRLLNVLRVFGVSSAPAHLCQETTVGRRTWSENDEVIKLNEWRSAAILQNVCGGVKDHSLSVRVRLRVLCLIIAISQYVVLYL